MATFKVAILLLVIFSLANKVVVEAIAPDSQIEDGSPYNPPEPSPEEREYLEECARKITNECAKPIVTYVFTDDKTRVPTECCRKLVSAGQRCHDGLVQLLASFNKYRLLAAYFVAEGKVLWDECVLDAEYGGH
ncbi:hypothetical protein SLE2022_151450 [Rubroshorea leprosula]